MKRSLWNNNTSCTTGKSAKNTNLLDILFFAHFQIARYFHFSIHLSLVLSLSFFSAQLNFSSLIDIPFLPSESVVLSFHVYEYRHTHTKHIFYKFVFVCQSVRQALFFRFISSSRLLCRSVRTLLSLSVVHFTWW